MTNKPPMMECGHAANATNSNGDPSCVICVGIHPGAEVIAEQPPDLSGRTARCPYITCDSEKSSDPSLPFFEHKPDREHDSFYCGCHGWN